MTHGFPDDVWWNKQSIRKKKIARADPLICCLGNLSMKRNIGAKATRRYTVSSVMRLSARCLMELRALQPDEEGQKNFTWYQALVPDQYDNIFAAKVWSRGWKEDEGMDEDDFEAPSKASWRTRSRSLTMAIDLTNQKQGTIERKNVKQRLQEDGQIGWQWQISGIYSYPIRVP